MAILGAHQSIAGGYYKAVERAGASGCDCLQVFTKNTNQWRAKPITPDEAQRFRQALAQNGVTCPLAHNSYLINLASPDAALWRRSIEAMVEELQRAHLLGIPWVVMHPGAYTAGSETEGLRHVIQALDEVLAQTRDMPVGCLLETTAGQGTCLGWRFEHLAAMLAGVAAPERLGVCFDTCHVFAAGYRLAPAAQYRATMKHFDQVVGLDLIRAFHLNDSLRELGSRVDRHAHIGQGKLGLEPFRRLLRDRRFRRVPTVLDKKTPKGPSGIPMILETPKGEQNGVNWDIINLETLRSLADGPEL